MASNRKAPPKCGKRLGHDSEQTQRSDKLHEEIKRVNDLLAAKTLELREFQLQHQGGGCGTGAAKP